MAGPDERVIRLRGINFQNDCWATGDYITNSATDHSETDYRRVSAMGTNVVRFMLTYRFFEQERQRPDLSGNYRKSGTGITRSCRFNRCGQHHQQMGLEAEARPNMWDGLLPDLLLQL